MVRAASRGHSQSGLTVVSVDRFKGITGRNMTTVWLSDGDGSVGESLQLVDVCEAVARLTENGWSARCIGDALGVSDRTVQRYRAVLRDPELLARLQSGESLRQVLGMNEQKENPSEHAASGGSFEEEDHSSKGVTRVTSQDETVGESDRRSPGTLVHDPSFDCCAVP